MGTQFDLRIWVGSLGLAIAASACGAVEEEPIDGATEASHRAQRPLRTRLSDTAGANVGSMTFKRDRGGVAVSASLRGLPPGFHGFHVHANDDPSNGEGCIAPAFTSTDGHFNPEGSVHGDHAGDMPALLVNDDGTGELSFVTDRFTLADIDGRAIIVHALADNYGNVPVGPNPDQYTPNSDAAIAATEATGNAGARIACGVID